MNGMQYTIKIEDTDPMGNSIIAMLKELAKEHSFLHVEPIQAEVEENIVRELESRYEYVMKNPEEGDSWENVKVRLLAK
jgi:hypothetical protein